MSMTIHQMRIFWAVSQAKSYTKASKMLGLAQPSLSQQISKLEDEAGSKLFNRIGGKIQLTDAGQFLYKKAELILANFEETEVGLKEFSDKTRGIIKVGMLSSVARNILPSTVKIFSEFFPNIEINVLEVAPAEAIDLLYARQLNIAVVAADSIAAANLSFMENEVFTDPYVLAVPKSLDISNKKSIKDLGLKQQNILKSTILFEFGSQHKKRIDAWFKKNIIDVKVLAYTRSYEVALSMVEAELGVVVLPALTAVVGSGRSYNVNLYQTNILKRRLVALTPNQFSKLEPSKTFIDSLIKAGKKLSLPKIIGTPDLFNHGIELNEKNL